MRNLSMFLNCYRNEIIERVQAVLIILGVTFVVFLCTQFLWVGVVLGVVSLAGIVHGCLELVREGGSDG